MSMAEATADTSAQTVDTGILVLDGDLLRPATLSLDALRQHRSVTLDPFDLRCFTTNRFIRTVDRYRGALLKDLIAAAGLRCESPGDFKRMVFIAAGCDGYSVMFSWHELFNTVIGERAIVAYECGGRPLGADEGAPVLFSGADIFAAPRHVNRLARVVARTIRL